MTERNINVLVASSMRVVGEAVRQELSYILGVDAACTTGLNVELLTEIQDVEADIVVLLNEEQEIPGVVSHIFDNYPVIVVIVFNPAKEQATLCQRTISMEKVSKSNLAELIKQISSESNLNYWSTDYDRAN